MKKIHSAMKALIKNKNNKFLVIEQKFENLRYFDLPGGRVKYGESPYDTLYREIKEETSLDTEIIKPLGVWWFFRTSGDQVICNTFLCKPKNINVNIDLNPENDENIINYHWLNKQELKYSVGKFLDKSIEKMFDLI